MLQEESHVTALLLQKTEECEMAARIGQSLLDENEKLCQEIKTLKMELEGAVGFEPELIEGIQKSLIKQSRETFRKLQQEMDLNQALQKEVADLSHEISNEKKKALTLKKKIEVMSSQLWDVQQDSSSRNDLIAEKDSTILRLRNALQESLEAGNDTGLVPNFIPEVRKINQCTQTKIFALEAKCTNDCKNEANPAVKAVQRDCKVCEALELQVRNLEAAQSEMQRLLDQSYEAIENLQSESFLTHISASTNGESEIDLSAELSFDSQCVDLTNFSTAKNGQILGQDSTPTTSKPSKLALSPFSKISINSDRPQAVQEAFPLQLIPVKSNLNKELEDLTYTMIGSWFLKYNRFQKNPKLRFFWANPYKRLLNWAEHPPSDEYQNIKFRSEYIVAVQWTDGPKAPQNYPPTAANSIYIALTSRVIKLVPISWEVHDHWISGLGFLLKKWKIMDDPGKEQGKSFGTPATDNLKTPEHVEVLSDPEANSRHRRIHTIISTSNKKLSTPSTIRKQHFRSISTTHRTPGNLYGNPFLIEPK